MSDNVETIPARLRAVSAARVGAPALVNGKETWSWVRLQAEIGRIAATLRHVETKPQDKIAVIGGNANIHAAAILAILEVGGCVVPLSTFLTAEAAATILKDAGVTTVLSTTAYASLIDSVVEQGRAVGFAKIILESKRAGWTSLKSDMGGVSAVDPVDVDPDWDAFIVYSSGTTGLPKGVVHQHGLRGMQTQAFADIGFETDMKTLLSTPLASNWTLTGLLTALWSGGTAILVRKFDTYEYLRLCEFHRPGFAFLVPTQIERLLRSGLLEMHELGTSTVKLSAGSPLSSDDKVAFHAAWPGGLVEIYGMTEGSVTTSIDVAARPDKTGSVGLPSPGIELRIIDEDGAELPVGDVGEIVGRSPYMMKAYHARPDATAALEWRAADGTLFQRTGDLGYLDEDGFLYISGRSKDMIIRGGLNVYPVDIEDVARRHDDVEDVAVIGVPDDRWGEVPLAILCVRAAEVEAEDIVTWVNARVAKPQSLVGAVIVDSLPRGSLDKVLKKELRETYRDWTPRR
ncbi:MAG: class I adenylate-forming enzyme family protein [Pseudomonadota bacterium]